MKLDMGEMEELFHEDNANEEERKPPKRKKAMKNSIKRREMELSQKAKLMKIRIRLVQTMTKFRFASAIIVKEFSHQGKHLCCIKMRNTAKFNNKVDETESKLRMIIV